MEIKYVIDEAARVLSTPGAIPSPANYKNTAYAYYSPADGILKYGLETRDSPLFISPSEYSKDPYIHLVRLNVINATPVSEANQREVRNKYGVIARNGHYRYDCAQITIQPYPACCGAYLFTAMSPGVSLSNRSAPTFELLTKIIRGAMTANRYGHGIGIARVVDQKPFLSKITEIRWGDAFTSIRTNAALQQFTVLPSKES